MNDLWRAVLTASATLVGGVILLVVTQVFTRFVVDPLVDFKRLLGRISYTLVFHAKILFNLSGYDVLVNPTALDEAKESCRDMASELNAAAAAVPLYDMLTDLGLVPPIENVRQASKELVGLSNVSRGTSADVVQKRYDRLATLLKIYTG